MKKLVATHIRVITASELLIICSKWIKINRTRTALRMGSSSTRRNHLLLRRPIGSRRMVRTFSMSMTQNSKLSNKTGNKFLSNISKFLESESSHGRRLRTDQESMIKTISICCLVVISLTLTVTTSTSKATTSLVDSMTK